MRGPKHTKLSIAGLTFLLASCAALPANNKLLDKYFEATRELKLTPVYPPREEFQVGDVFFRSYDPAKINDLESQASVWIGTMQSVRDDANTYLQTRINYKNTGATSGLGSALSKNVLQDDFVSGSVALNNGARNSLPAFAFPTISGSASTAGSFGGVDFLRSFGFGFGRSESVSISFPDVRAFGAPLGAYNSGGKANAEYLDIICPKAHVSMYEAFNQLNLENVQLLCREGRACEISVITRAYRTRSIEYTYTSAKIAQLAASQIRGIPATIPDKTLPIPGNVNFDVTIAEDADGSNLKGLIDALQANTAVTGADSPTSSLNFVGLQGNSLKFDRTYQKPIAIAYESFDFRLDPAALRGGDTAATLKARKFMCGLDSLAADLEKKK